jgi:hypothetical protein
MLKALAATVLLSSAVAVAQSPELSMRELASGQVKKGVRAIGFGGDGATWGNYSLVYRDTDTALVDSGWTGYDNGNTFSFVAAATTTPALWRGLALYAIGLTQWAPGIETLNVRGTGTNNSVFLKAALPLPYGFAAGLMLAYEVSRFDSPALSFKTDWRPSGGFGVTWQPHKRWLLGVRAILNHDWEHRYDAMGEAQGLARSYEFRAGVSFSPWKGALIDVGGTLLDRANGIARTEKITPEPNLGFEQAFWDRKLVLRTGLDESTYGAGVSVKFKPLSLDVAYLYNLGQARIGTLFGQHSNSVIVTLTLDYGALRS